MKESSLMIKEKEMVLLPGQMEDNILENGKEENNMEGVPILVKMELRRMENGKMEGKSDG